MNGSVDNLEQQPPPPESWEVADVDASMSRLMLNSKHNHTHNNSSPDLSKNCFSDFGSVSVAPVKSYSVDQFLLDALQNPRERLSVLRMEQDVEKFVRDSSKHQMEFQQLPTSYLRLAAHRVAQHYSLQSTVLLDSSLPDGSGSRIIVHKTSECSLPFIRLADIPVKLPTDESSNSVVKVAIKQRPNKKSQILGSNSDLQRSNSLKSVEERKEEYNRARARIFSSSSSSFNGKQETDPRRQEMFHCGSLGASEVEEAYSSTEVDVNSGRGSVDFPAGTSRSGESRIEEPISRSRANSKVAIFRDPEVERNDPDYDRSYDRYAQRFDPGFGFNGGSYSVQPMYAPVLTYNTEFPQLGPAHTHRAPSISTEHQSHTLAQHLPGSWMAPSSSQRSGMTFIHPLETMVTSFNPNHASTLYMQYPSQRSGMTFIHPHEQVHNQLAQSQQQQQSDVSFGLARSR